MPRLHDCRGRRGSAIHADPAARGLTLALLLIAGPLAAQQVPSQLSLEDALTVAMRTNPQYLQVTNDVDVSRAGIKSAWGAILPTLNLSAGFSSTYRESKTAPGNFGETLTSEKTVITKSSSANQSISVGGLTLFDGGRQFRQVGIAKRQTDLALASVTSQANTLRASVTRAYYQVVSSESLIQLEQQLLSNARDRLDLVQQQFRLAAAPQTALLGAQIEVSQRQQSLASAQADVRRNRLNLLQLMGVNGEPEFELVSGVPEVFDPATLDVDALVARALENHPTIIQGRANVDLSDKQAANARARRLPTLQLSLPGYSFGEQQDGLWNAWGSLGAPNNSFSFGISASYPLFNGFQTSQDVAQSRAAAQDRRYGLQQTRLQVEKDVRLAIIELEQRHNDLQLAQEQAQNAQLRLELGQEQYRLGAMTFTEFQQIIEQNDQTQRQVLTAQLAFLNARVTLEENIGGPLSTTR